MNTVSLEELKRECSELEVELRATDNKDLKRVIRIRIGRVEAKIASKLNAAVARGEFPATEHVSASSGLNGGDYRGPTSHGVSLGDGCYWNRGGHH